MSIPLRRQEPMILPMALFSARGYAVRPAKLRLGDLFLAVAAGDVFDRGGRALPAVPKLRQAGAGVSYNAETRPPLP